MIGHPVTFSPWNAVLLTYGFLNTGVRWYCQHYPSPPTHTHIQLLFLCGAPLYVNVRSGGGDSNISVVHMRNQRSRLGVKMCLFLRKRSFWIPLRGIWGCFSPRGEIAIRVCFENLWSCMCTTQVFEGPQVMDRSSEQVQKCKTKETKVFTL